MPNPFKFTSHLLPVLAFFLCLQAIIKSTELILFAPIVILVLGLFFTFRTNDKPFFILLAVGPLVNVTALHSNYYVYTFEVVSLLYIGCLLIKNKPRFSILKSDFATILFFFLVLTLCVILCIHIFMGNSFNDEIRLIRVFLIGSLVVLVIKNATLIQLKTYYVSITVTTFIVSIWGISDFFSHGFGFQDWQWEPKSVFTNSEVLALYLCGVIPIVALGITLIKNKVLFYGSSLVTITAIFVLFTTKSRTGISAIIVFLMFFAFTRLKKALIIKMWWALFVLAIVLTGLATIVYKTMDLRQTGIENFFVSLFFSRISDWQNGFHAFLKFPLFGSGTNDNYYNLYLQLACQYGVIGLFLFLLFCGFTFYQYYKTKRSGRCQYLQTGFFWSLVVLLLAGIGESDLGNQLGIYLLVSAFLCGGNNRDGFEEKIV